MSEELNKYLIPHTDRAIRSLNLNSFERMWANFGPNEGTERVVQSIKDGFNTAKKYKYYEDNGYHIIDNIPSEFVHKGKEDWPVEYKYNSDFFRCDHFKKDHDGLHVVFSGCSNTEGVGSNIDRTWSHMLYKSISEKTKTSGYFNLGKGGLGWHNIISNFQVYVNSFGAPDILVILHPNILRDYYWDNINNQWMYNQTDPLSKETVNNQKIIRQHRENFLNWAVAWNLFIEYCKSIGTKVIWSTWDTYEDKNIIDLGIFNDTYATIEDTPRELIEKMCPGGKFGKDYIEVRDGHPGFLNQTNWYNRFWEELVDRGWIND